MVSISKPLNAGALVHYHKEMYSGAAGESNYFCEDGRVTGQWFGNLASEFGLIGRPVEELHIQRIANGQHPITGEQLIKHRAQGAKEQGYQKSDAAWKEYLETQFADALGDRRDPFRKVDQREAWKPSGERILPASGLILPERTEYERELIAMQEMAAKFYAERLVSPEGKTGRDYLDGRSITEESRAEFRLGVAGSRNELLHHMKGRYSREALLDSGLFYESERDGSLQDRFKHRIMFPIQDARGEVIAFAGRRMDANKDRKYINSPNGPIYRKSEHLYNVHRAAVGSGRIVMVEGNLDAIQSRQAGVRDVVALGGVTLTGNGSAAVDQIRSVAHSVVLNLDGNETGKKGTEKHIPGLLEAGLHVRALSLEGDPDKFVLKYGAAAYDSAVDRARPLVEWLIERAKEKFKVRDSYGKVDALRWVTEQLGAVRPEHRVEMIGELARYLKTPVQDEGVKASHKPHRAGIDITFSPPKSFSIMALVGGKLADGTEVPGDERLVASHNRAVIKTLESMQQYSQARLRDSAPVTTNSIAAAIFLHDTARAVEGEPPAPQLHSHTFWANMTRVDKVRSLDPAWLYRIQSYGNAVYMSEIANDARRFGYELVRGKNFSMEIKGFSPDYLVAMSQRREEIEAEKKLRGVTGAEAGERINLELRQKKVKWEPEALRAEHRRQAEAFGQNPALIQEAARLRGGFVFKSEARRKLANEALNYAKDRLFESQAVNPYHEIIRDALRYRPDALREEDILAVFDERRAEFIRTSHYRASAPREHYTTPEMQAFERESIQIVLGGNGKSRPIASMTKHEFVAGYKVRETPGGKFFEMTKAQMAVAYHGITSPNQFMIVAGAAGAGKSSSFEVVAEIAEQHHKAGFRVVGMAATSSATNNLRDMGIDAQTLQLHIARGVKAGETKTVYLLDEGSLVGAQSFRKFLDSVRTQDRVIIAYDHRQHHSVEAGRIVWELEQAGVQTIRLEDIMRQRGNEELLAVIEKFRDSFGPQGSQNMIEGLRMLDGEKRVREIPNRDNRFAAIAEYYAMHPDETLIVSPDNRSIKEMNQAVRSKLQAAGKVKADVYEGEILAGARNVKSADKKLASTYEVGNVIRWSKAGTLGGRGRVSSGQYTEVVGVDVERNEVTIRVPDAFGEKEVTFDPRTGQGEIFETETRRFALGDKIQVTRPWTIKAGDVIANRAIGTITKLDAEGNGEVDFEGRRVKWNAKEMRHVDWGYSMTSYSAQSLTVPRVAVHVDTGDSRIRPLIEKALMYVGASRGAEDVAVFTDDKEVLLSEKESPILRQFDKPMALSEEEQEEIGEGIRVG